MFCTNVYQISNLRFKALKLIKPVFDNAASSIPQTNPTLPHLDLILRGIFHHHNFLPIKSVEVQRNVLSTEGTDKSKLSVGCLVNEIQSEL